MRNGGLFSTEKHLKQNWQKDIVQELGKTAHILWTYDFMKKKKSFFDIFSENSGGGGAGL